MAALAIMGCYRNIDPFSIWQGFKSAPVRFVMQILRFPRWSVAAGLYIRPRTTERYSPKRPFRLIYPKRVLISG